MSRKLLELGYFWIGRIFDAAKTILPVKFSLFMAGLVFVSFLSSLMCASPVSAASYLNVSASSNGSLSFGSVKPSAAGVSATTTDTLTVNTNCSVGYRVYVSGQNGKGTSLTNTDPNITTNNTVATSSATISSPAVLSNNTWGINSVDNGTYAGLPAYASATSIALTTRSSVAEQTTVPIYYGAKVNDMLAPGTYTGDILYTVLPDSACSIYTIHFNSNGGSGNMSDQVINVGQATNLRENAFTRTDLIFLGWSNSANGKTGTAVDGIGTTADVDYTDKQSVTDIADFNTTKNLYAIWAYIDMQSWTGCNDLTANSTIHLRDTRDNTMYYVKKLPDGKCWMIENLTLGFKGGLALTSDDTNMQPDTPFGTAPDGEGKYYLPPAGKQGAINTSSTTSSTTNAAFATSSSNDSQAKSIYRAATPSDSDTRIAAVENTSYYNFYAASLGFSYYNDGRTAGTSPRDICPKGWRLPRITTTYTETSGTRDFTGDLAALANTYNPSASWSSTSLTVSRYTTDTTIRNNMIAGDSTSLDRYGNNGALGLSYTGYYSGSTLSYLGARGYLWVSSIYDNTSGYRPYLNTSSFYPQSNSYKCYGYSIRCIAQNSGTNYNYTVNYNSNGATSGSPTKTTENAAYSEASIVMPLQGSMVKDGYGLKGWALTPGATTEQYAPGASITISKLSSDAATAGQNTATGATITLYAVWGRLYTLTLANGNTSAVSSMSIKYNKTGATISSGSSVPEGDSVTISCAPKTGYHCTGWTSSNTSLIASSTSTSYTFNMPAGNITMTANGAPNTYTINYNANGGSGTTSSTSVTYGTNVTLATNNFTAPAGYGYVFKEWNTSSSGTGTSYSSGQSGISPTTLKSNVTSINGGSVTLYAIWVAYMQDFDPITRLTNVGDQMELEDIRDGKKYTAKRLPDGKVWMTQNLALGMNATTTGLTLTSANTNIDNGTTYYLPPAGKQGSITSSATLTSTTAANFSTSNDNQAKTQFRTKNTSYTNDSDTGYYNAYTATLGFSYYNDGVTAGTSTRDICPKGWELPKVTNNGESISRLDLLEYTRLVYSYNSSATWTGDASTDFYFTSDSTVHTNIHTGATAASNNYAGFSYAGYYNGTTLTNVGSGGNYQSASIFDTENNYVLGFDSTNVAPQGVGASKNSGIPVRCIAKAPSMQEFSASANLPNVGDQTMLTDIRDGKKYFVKRLPDGKVWMVQNLTIGSDGAKTLTSANTNIDTTSTYYLPPPGKQGSSTITTSSTLTATTNSNFGTSNDNRAKTRFRAGDNTITNDSDTGYYNFYTATLGYSYYMTSGTGAGKNYGSSTRDICPKGWRMPKTPNTKTKTVSSVGSDNDFAYLAKSYNSSASWTNATTADTYLTTDSTIRTGMFDGVATSSNNYAGFSYSGYWNGADSSASSVGSAVYYWPASIYDIKGNYSLRFLTSDNSTYPQHSYSKYRGVAVRCIAKT